MTENSENSHCPKWKIKTTRQRKKVCNEAAGITILNLWLTSSCPYDKRRRIKNKLKNINKREKWFWFVVKNSEKLKSGKNRNISLI